MIEQQIQLYTSPDGQVQLQVTQDAETLWLTQAQMAELFGTKRPAITKHLSNIYKSGELEEATTCSNLEHVAKHNQTYKTKQYNLDAIISVGYRVNSSRATQFRIWATGVLKQELIRKGEATELFGQIRGEGLASAIGTIEQGFGDEWFYPNVASRAANLLYLVIKNHPLADGNKRSGSFLFLWYLRINQRLLAKPVEKMINDNTLVALALLVAESKPDQKELMIRLVEHFIVLVE